jgi:hypothetical protein
LHSFGRRCEADSCAGRARGPPTLGVPAAPGLIGGCGRRYGGRERPGPEGAVAIGVAPVHHRGREARAGTAAPRQASVLVFALTRPRGGPEESVPWIARPDVRVVGRRIQTCARRSDDTDALSSVVQRDTTIHPSTATKEATGFELGTLPNRRTSCSLNCEELPAPCTQLRRDWSLLDLVQAAYDLAGIVAISACSGRSHPCAGETGPGQIDRKEHDS